MQPQSTDTIDLARRYRTRLALTGLTAHQFHAVPALIATVVATPARGGP